MDHYTLFHFDHQISLSAQCCEWWWRHVWRVFFCVDVHHHGNATVQNHSFISTLGFALCLILWKLLLWVMSEMLMNLAHAHLSLNVHPIDCMCAVACFLWIWTVINKPLTLLFVVLCAYLFRLHFKMTLNALHRIVTGSDGKEMVWNWSSVLFSFLLAFHLCFDFLQFSCIGFFLPS